MKYFLTILFLFLGAASFAQKQYTYNDQVWLSYFNQSRVNDKWSLWFDASIRTRNQLVHQFSQGIVRVGGTWIANENWRFTAGYAYMHHFANSAHPLADRPEHRPFEMIQWQKQLIKWRIVQSARLEQRFRHRIENGDIGDGYNFNHRARYGIVVSRAFSKNAFEPNTISLQGGGELFGNFGKEVLYNHFDQLRLHAGLNYHVNSYTSLLLGYLYQYQKFSNGRGFNKLNGIRVTITQQMDWRKKI
ncbi:MAG: DUF2490 domain-containing protein [Flavitalea sp.]